MEKFKYGFIYVMFDYFLCKIRHLNLVEWFKDLMNYLFCVPQTPTLVQNNPSAVAHHKAVVRITVDIFIILKRIYLIILLAFSIKGIFNYYMIVYLLIFNLFTYFFYHIWNQSIDPTDIDSSKRGFLHGMVAFMYSNICFAYIYWFKSSVLFSKMTVFQSLIFSFSNSMTISYDQVKALSDIGSTIVVLQVLITFVFISLIIANSIPKTR